MAEQGQAPVPLPMAQPRVVAHPRNLTLEVFRALAHPIRLELIAHVAARGPLCVCHLEDSLPYSQPKISKHLAVLRQAGLLQSRREGSWVYYAVDPEALDAARDFIEQLETSLGRPRLADSCDDPDAG
jgi:ArsR family transcriptional regulator, arsenate/arsenite/antimonite-responsive transcriptional repressor